MKKKKSNPYKEANEAFLAAKAREEGIVVLDKWECTSRPNGAMDP